MSDSKSYSLSELFDGLERVERKLDTLLAERSRESIEPQEDPLLSRKEAADLLGVSLGTLNNLTNAGRIVKYKMGKRTLYKKSELLSDLEEIKLSPG